MKYKVKLEIFEGPLDLLLYLIKKDEVDIYDIPIAKVTDQYLEYLEMMNMLDLNIAGEFIVMAATLMQIKSRMLLPVEEMPQDEMEEEDPRSELVRKLLEYKKFKEVSDKLAEIEATTSQQYTRKAEERPLPEIEDESAFFETSIFDLLSAFSKILKDIPKDTFYKVIKDKFTVADKIHDIVHMLVGQPRIYFGNLFKKAGSKFEIVVTFLAVLELIRLKEILIVQEEPFGEIEIIRNPNSVKQTAQSET
ncbi:MAG: segregation/condensation protein A [Candidatus Omnitrophica bacterium]|nr:segregation/condensation protein A [Candidatus Omnitrophota bacterium]